MTADLAEQIAWQRRAVSVLGDLLAQAARDSLPVLWWTVDGAGAALVGRSLARPSSSRRGELEAWGRALGIELHEHRWRDGGGNITGSDKQRKTQHGFCTIALTADIYADDDGSGDGDEDG